MSLLRQKKKRTLSQLLKIALKIRILPHFFLGFESFALFFLNHQEEKLWAEKILWPIFFIFFSKQLNKKKKPKIGSARRAMWQK